MSALVRLSNQCLERKLVCPRVFGGVLEGVVILVGFQNERDIHMVVMIKQGERGRA